MPKTITSPVKRWPGTVTLSDPMTLPQLAAYEKALRAAMDAITQNAGAATFDLLLLPGLLACVEKWELEGISNPSPATFPGKPHKARTELIAWLTNEILPLYKDADEIPNG